MYILIINYIHEQLYQSVYIHNVYTISRIVSLTCFPPPPPHTHTHTHTYTVDNPYVNIEGPDPLSIMLVDVFQLVAVTLYKVDGEQMSAELSTVTVTATETGDLNIVGTSASDPYRT